MVPVVADLMGIPGEDEKAQKRAEKKRDEALRKQVIDLLANGLETQIDPIPEDNFEFAVIIDELEHLDPDDVVGKLVVSGYIDHPHPENKQRCLECIYYKPRRRWCIIPELDLPAEAEWWCRLWRM